jgi:hypothetical protein
MLYNVWLRGLRAGLSICISSNSEGSKKLPDDGRLRPKHVGASIQNKGLVKSVHIVGHFYYIYV